MAIRLKRAYEPAKDTDGFRVLVDRMWPRGIAKEDAKLDFWAKEISPSNELRQWYNHDPGKWAEFRSRYFAELDDKADAMQQLVTAVAGRDVTLIYSSKSKWNNALALKEYLELNYLIFV